MEASELDPAALFDLSGNRALVTGCRRGIGLAMAEALARAGADVVGASAQLEATGSEVERRVHAAGREFSGYQVDFADRAAVEQFVAEVTGGDRAIDILVNNAGTIARAPVSYTHLDVYKRQVRHVVTENARVLEVVDLLSQGRTDAIGPLPVSYTHLRELHMRHHFEDDSHGYGISAPWWDFVFGTLARRSRERPR